MARLNPGILVLRDTNKPIFPEVSARVRAAFGDAPETLARLIHCGIADVSEPLPRVAVLAMQKASAEMAERATFRGYCPGQGYPFLREAIARHDFSDCGLPISAEEIFISDGTKGACGDLLDILARGQRLGIPNPVYAIYLNSGILSGHAGEARDGAFSNVTPLFGLAEDDYLPLPPTAGPKLDIIYLCHPHNPIGGVYRREHLAAWVEYALRHDSIILFDIAYGSYVKDPLSPKSIYEIPGAERVAIELHSFSKDCGFTGVRCAYTVIPEGVTAEAPDGSRHPVNALWKTRTNTKYNGVPYVVQRAAEAMYTPEGRAAKDALVEHYLENAVIIRRGVERAGLVVFGGRNAPFLWVKCPTGMSSWEAFEKILREARIVVTPGVGFGSGGEGFFRICTFCTRENATTVAERLAKLTV